MKPIWLIEAVVWGETGEALAQEIQRQSLSFRHISYTELVHGAREESTLPAENACVLFYGSHPLMHYIHKYRPDWKPGGWCSFEALSCTNYYPHFGRFLRNDRYIMLPGIEAIRQQEFVFRTFGVEDEVFVRPNSVEKVIPGRCIHQEEFATALAPTRYDPATLVVVSSPKPIQREWRLVIVGDRPVAASQYPVAASQYRDNGEVVLESGCPTEVWDFAVRLLEQVSWRPDPAFMMDICESEGRLFLLELNAFSCSGLYACPLDVVVSEASAVAQREWER